MVVLMRGMMLKNHSKSPTPNNGDKRNGTGKAAPFLF